MSLDQSAARAIRLQQVLRMVERHRAQPLSKEERKVAVAIDTAAEVAKAEIRDACPSQSQIHPPGGLAVGIPSQNATS